MDSMVIPLLGLVDYANYHCHEQRSPTITTIAPPPLPLRRRGGAGSTAAGAVTTVARWWRLRKLRSQSATKLSAWWKAVSIRRRYVKIKLARTPLRGLLHPSEGLVHSSLVRKGIKVFNNKPIWLVWTTQRILIVHAIDKCVLDAASTRGASSMFQRLSNKTFKLAGKTFTELVDSSAQGWADAAARQALDVGSFRGSTIHTTRVDLMRVVFHRVPAMCSSSQPSSSSSQTKIVKRLVVLSGREFALIHPRSGRVTDCALLSSLCDVGFKLACERLPSRGKSRRTSVDSSFRISSKGHDRRRKSSSRASFSTGAGRRTSSSTTTSPMRTYVSLNKQRKRKGTADKFFSSPACPAKFQLLTPSLQLTLCPASHGLVNEWMYSLRLIIDSFLKSESVWLGGGRRARAATTTTTTTTPRKKVQRPFQWPITRAAAEQLLH